MLYDILFPLFSLKNDTWPEGKPINFTVKKILSCNKEAVRVSFFNFFYGGFFCPAQLKEKQIFCRRAKLFRGIWFFLFQGNSFPLPSTNILAIKLFLLFKHRKCGKKD